MKDYYYPIIFRKMENGDPLLEQVESTYELSFPEEERRLFLLVHKLITEQPAFSVYALLHNEKYIGFLTTWKFEKFVYIEHFAIEATARNGGFGAKVMQQFLAKEQDVILEVEVPHDELSRRRVCFYERLGFVLDSHIYFQPSYRKGGDEIEMRLMSYGQIDMGNYFEEICHTLYENVYGVNKKG